MQSDALYHLTPERKRNTLLIEAAWEVCNQVGGIYTVIRTKVPAAVGFWGDNYCLIGPWFANMAQGEFDPIEPGNDAVGRAVRALLDKGVEVHYGRWLVSGRPRVILLNPLSDLPQTNANKHYYWEAHGIASPTGDDLYDKVLAFSHLVTLFYEQLTAARQESLSIIAHFHEWMAGLPIADIRRNQWPIRTVFTTHATLLGRYIAMNDEQFYEKLDQYDWLHEAQHYGIEHMVRIERAATAHCDVMTTVSQVTGSECEFLLGRKPDLLLPNGLNIERFVALHEFQNLHQQYKNKIHQFVMGHFFQSYSFDLDNTLYFFTSGRYEYRNKGFDLTLEALARLNWRMQQAGMSTTVVMFFVTRRPYRSINPEVLESRGVMEELRETCNAIEKQIGERLFQVAASQHEHRLPDLNQFVDDYWRLRFRRTLQSWRSTHLPSIITHNLIDDQDDEILNFMRRANLLNHAHDRVKMVYHPDFISPMNPLFGMEYGQFVRGCHLGIFPSYYEPWGYTPLECGASGVPSVTSDLSGFGDYVMNAFDNHKDCGMYVVNRRRKTFYQAADQLADILFQFVQFSRRDRINQRNKVESLSATFDWKYLGKFYLEAYDRALA
ncbi:glycogen(starch) synthase [Catalinimonas alkaloidigena]|uniref:Glycogen(Starch) synthase n=1 Tax=Catalinimonas alkaloidigena TaxID=1075417 RepID=A0A1G9EE93_9BACT|nr:glycosyltransferase [Catalinimonas alkaloidigena]SDK74355.1 glycogen(starch) synthase [Catalinimonas alkaloidigena]